MATAIPFADWQPYRGPRGGEGWRNPETGAIVYGDKPGEGGGLPQPAREFTHDGELVRGQIGQFPVSEGDFGASGKLTKATRKALTEAIEDPDISRLMKIGGIRSIHVVNTASMRQRGAPKNWTAAAGGGRLIIHPRTAQAIAASAVPERREGGMRRVIAHEAAHGLWGNLSTPEQEQFSEALAAHPDVLAEVAGIVSTKANPEAFAKTGDRAITEAFAELSAMQVYDPARFAKLPEPIQAAIGASRARDEGRLALWESMEARRAAQFAEWERFDGPRGGNGWRNTSTGEVRYQDEMPGERGEAEGGARRIPERSEAEIQKIAKRAAKNPKIKKWLRRSEVKHAVWHASWNPRTHVIAPEGGAFFADRQRSADFGTHSMAAFVRLRNPYMALDDDIETVLNAMPASAVETAALSGTGYEGQGADYLEENDIDSFRDALRERMQSEDQYQVWQDPGVIAAMKKAGYDGVIMPDAFGGETEYVVFDAANILPIGRFDSTQGNAQLGERQTGIEPAGVVPARTTPAIFSQFAERGPVDSKSGVVDDIVAAGAADARLTLNRAVTRILDAAQKTRGGLTLGLMPEIAAAIHEVLPDLQAALVDSGQAAALAGAADAVTGVSVASPGEGIGGPPAAAGRVAVEDFAPTRVRFPVAEQAMDVLAKAPVEVHGGYQATAEAVRRGSFAVTADLANEMVEDLRGVLVANLETGNVGKFADDVKELFQEGGGLSDARLHMVFRNNVGAALSDSSERSLAAPLVAPAFPYRRYRATHDSRTRETHRALETHGLNGTAIYRADDPVWQEFRPPWDYNCRCAFAPVSVDAAARAGVAEAVNWWERAQAEANRFGGRPTDYLDATAPAEGEMVEMPPFRASPEWQRGAQFAEDEYAGQIRPNTDAAVQFAQWQAYEGPRGGKGWKDAETGRIVYGDKPSEREPVQRGERFKAGKKLTPEEKQKVLGGLVDAYKDAGIEKIVKGHNQVTDEPIYGYPYVPEVFRRSDITGAMLRYYIFLPDGRVAHPTEVFGNVSQRDVTQAIVAAENEEFARKRGKESFQKKVGANGGEATQITLRNNPRNGPAAMASSVFVLNKETRQAARVHNRHELQAAEAAGFTPVNRGERSEWADGLVGEDVYQFAEWEKYEGPRGGKGWRDTETGRIVYGDKPGEVEDLPEDATGAEIVQRRNRQQAKANYDPEQKRAAAGGEYGPNGEWYKGGAWIATTDMPKRTREKIKRSASKKEPLDAFEKWQEIPPGKVSIFHEMAGTWFNHRNGEVNEQALEYYKFTDDEREQIRDAAARFMQGERLLDVTDAPVLAGFSAIARMMEAELPIPGVLVEKAQSYFGADFDKYKPNQPQQGQQFAEGARAPAGGINIGGKEYKGGQFIPGDVVAGASEAQREALGVETGASLTDEERREIEDEKRRRREQEEWEAGMAKLVATQEAEMAETIRISEAGPVWQRSRENFQKWFNNRSVRARAKAKRESVIDSGRRSARKSAKAKARVKELGDLWEKKQLEINAAGRKRAALEDAINERSRVWNPTEDEVARLDAMDEELRQLNAQSRAYSNEIISVTKTIQGHQKNLRRAIYRKLSVDEPVEFDISWKIEKGTPLDKKRQEGKVENPGTDLRNRVKKATTQIGKLVSQKINFAKKDAINHPGGIQAKPMGVAQLTKTQKQRAYANGADIILGAGDDPRTIWHEIGHTLESLDDRVADAARGFLLHRVTDETPRHLASKFPQHDYEDDEFGRKDDFVKAFSGEGLDAENYAYYTGKHYPWGSTEIMAMGMQMLWQDPVGLAERDPEYFDLVTSVLDGSLFEGGE